MNFPIFFFNKTTNSFSVDLAPYHLKEIRTILRPKPEPLKPRNFSGRPKWDIFIQMFAISPHTSILEYKKLRLEFQTFHSVEH